MEIMEDNQSAIEMARNPKYHSRTKHIDIRHHFIRDQVEAGNIHLTYCITQQMLADLLTKSLPMDQFRNLRKQMGMIRNRETTPLDRDKEC